MSESCGRDLPTSVTQDKMCDTSWSRLQPTANNHTILKYTPTDRRLKGGQLDYFILDPPHHVRVPVKPWDFIGAKENENNPLHKNEKSPKRN